MVDYSYKVNDFICNVPAYADCRESLSQTIDKILEFNPKSIKVMDEKARTKSVLSKKNVFKFVKNQKEKNSINRLNIHAILGSDLCSIIAYPESDIFEIYTIMKQLGINRVPVARAPWNKTLMGFLDYKILSKQLEGKSAV
jgi:signal-transduction protein with cAMP-binding, CBS, and nucleotidyltransferase domain